MDSDPPKVRDDPTTSEVGRDAVPPYPGIAQAIRLLLFSLVLTVAFSIPFVVVGVVKPAALALANLAAAGVVIRRALKRSGATLHELLPMRPVSPSILVAITVTVVGLSAVLSEADNLLREVLPFPARFAQVWREMVGGQYGLFGSILLVSIVAPLWEESLFRGIMLRGFVPRYGVRKSIVVSTVLFALSHLNPWQLASAAAGGWLLAWCFIRTGSLVPGIFGHAVNNSLGFVVRALDIEIPGYTVGVTDAVQHQPLWFDAMGVTMALVGLIWLRRLFNDSDSRRAAASGSGSGLPGAG